MKHLTSALCVAALIVPACLFAQAKHRVVVELNTGGEAAYLVALNNVENLKKAFEKDTTEVVIVCHGDGINMLFSHENKLQAKIEALQKGGVQFDACNNTMRKRNIAKDQIFAFAMVVDSGTAEVIRKQEAGWSYLKR